MCERSIFSGVVTTPKEISKSGQGVLQSVSRSLKLWLRYSLVKISWFFNIWSLLFPGGFLAAILGLARKAFRSILAAYLDLACKASLRNFGSNSPSSWKIVLGYSGSNLESCLQSSLEQFLQQFVLSLENRLGAILAAFRRLAEKWPGMFFIRNRDSGHFDDFNDSRNSCNLEIADSFLFVVSQCNISPIFCEFVYLCESNVR